jgi:CheY-like chemotaxis protein
LWYKPPVPPSPDSRRRVLIVDDNVDAADTLSEILATFGLHTAIAHDGTRALEIAREFKPDVALLDIGLPTMDGYELAGYLRDAHGPSLYLVAITGFGQEQDRERSATVGFDRHLTKPVQIETLLTAIGVERTK